MTPVAIKPAGELGTVDLEYLDGPVESEAIRDVEGVVYIHAFGRWYGYAASHRISRSFRPVTP